MRFYLAEAPFQEGRGKPTVKLRAWEGSARVSIERKPVRTLHLLENSDLLNGYGPFIFGSHVGEYVWFDSGKTETNT